MRHIVCFLAIGLGAALPGHAHAQDPGFNPQLSTFAPSPLPDANAISPEAPVVLTADQVDYLQQENLVIASGKVEVIQGETILLADKIVYDRLRNVVSARGNVSVMDGTGSVMFADEIELRDQLSTGVIEQFKARLIDDSTFAASRAEKVDENIVTLENAVYSPCKVKCDTELAPGEKAGDPLWQLRADHVKIDQAEQTVTYKNASMELYGVPVFYTPYLSHATPGADNKSGIMTPEYQRDDNLGNIYRLPLYYAIAPDRDLVFIPAQTSREGPVARAMYRQRFDTGRVDVDTSITNPRDRDSAGNLIAGRQVRGHIFANGEFEEDEDTRWGFDVKRATDDTYLRKYDIDGQTLLTSRIYGETFDFLSSSDRNGFSAEAIAFQGLAATDDSNRIPLILPLMNFDYESDPGAYGSRYFINSNALLLTRDIGAESRRLSNTVGWRLPYITDDGQVIEFTTQLRGDLYEVSDVLLSDGTVFNGTTGRIVPEASLLWRYPFISEFSRTSVLVEPIVNAVISPKGGNSEEIPNEDSLLPEFTDSNLFSENRFTGYDRIEQGPRVSYGLRGLVNYHAAYIDWLVGQHYRADADRSFPFSNDLNDNLSDYVGKVGLQINPLYLAYRFRMDKDSLTQLRKELEVRYSGKRFTLATSYLSLQNDPIFSSREEIYSMATVQATDNWSFGLGGRRDLEIGQITNIGAQLTFKNECISISNVISREYTRDREVKPNTSYLFLFTLKNLN